MATVVISVASCNCQEKLAQFVREVEQLRAGDDITAQEWEIIERRAARRDLATDEEVEKVFSRYR
jgi:hypothetical protein